MLNNHLSIKSIWNFILHLCNNFTLKYELNLIKIVIDYKLYIKCQIHFKYTRNYSIFNNPKIHSWSQVSSIINFLLNNFNFGKFTGALPCFIGILNTLSQIIMENNYETSHLHHLYLVSFSPFSKFIWSSNQTKGASWTMPFEHGKKLE